MKTTIQNKLQQIEKAEGIQILFACESGSRAWGFPSPDSDYDVRFIYAHSFERYLSVKRPVEQFTFPINDELDISGWDLQKTLGLVYKSNSAVFEWLQSPIVYKNDQIFKEELFQLCQSYSCPRSIIHHYLGITNGAIATINEDKFKLKKLFYVLRSLLSARWYADNETIAPMNIFPLMALFPARLKEKVTSLIELKASADENFTIEPDNDIKAWITETFEYCTYKVESFDKKQFNTDDTDRFFRKTICQ